MKHPRFALLASTAVALLFAMSPSSAFEQTKPTVKNGFCPIESSQLPPASTVLTGERRAQSGFTFSVTAWAKGDADITAWLAVLDRETATTPLLRGSSTFGPGAGYAHLAVAGAYTHLSFTDTTPQSKWTVVAVINGMESRRQQLLTVMVIDRAPTPAEWIRPILIVA
jgi:hypothetical protein